MFHISAENIDFGYSIETPRQGGSNEHPQLYVFEQKEENYECLCKPKFYRIKVGFKGINRHVFVMVKYYLLFIQNGGAVQVK